nr:acetylxylan esterase [Microbacterium amylolyticum]
MPLPQLREYRPDHTAPADLGEFWKATLEESRAAGAATRTEPVDNGLALVDTVDVTFSGFAGDPVKAWYHRPSHVEPTAIIVEYLGYSGGRGLPHQHAEWVSAGYGHLIVDSRGQGYAHGNRGDTADPHGGDPSAPGVMTRGIGDRSTYYYRRLFTDAAFAVDVARELAPGVPVFTAGGSQGGGITIAATALSDGIAGALVDVPFLCDFPRATTMTDRYPYREIVTYLASHRGAEDTVYRTLSYFDGANLASLASAPTLFSVGLMDLTCPPSTVFAAFNAWGSDDRQIEVYPFNDHEGGGPHQRRIQLDWVRARV